MAMTVAAVQPANNVTVDGKRSFKALCTFDVSYPTGGLAVDMSKLPFKKVTQVYVDHVAATAAASFRGLVADVSTPTAPKLKLYTAASTEAGNATDQSASIFTVIFVGS